MRFRSSRAGFSLIEVSLALMVVGFGLLGIFHLFPAGLRASFDATAETRIGQFADEVFNQLYADSAVDWGTAFSAPLDIDLAISSVHPGGASMGGEILLDGTEMLVEYPAGSLEYLRCECEANVIMPENRLAQVELRVRYGRSGGYTQAFYTEVYNFGM